MARAVLIYLCLALLASLPPAKKVCAGTSESVLRADDMCTRVGGAQECALHALQRASLRAFQKAWTSGRSNGEITATEHGAANVETATEVLRDERRHAQESASASRVILHVGPPKAGSTTIQEETLRLRDSLREDGIEVLVTNDFVPAGSPQSQLAETELNMWHVASCFDNECACGDWSVIPACDTLSIYQKLELCIFRLSYQDLAYAHRYICPTLRDNLHRFARQHRISFLSGETFAGVQNISLLASMLKGVNTTIIIVYRPFHELLASAYREIEHDVRLKSNGILDIGILGLSFNSFATTEYMHYAFSQHSVWAVYQRYRQFFHDVRLHTLSDELVPKIICDDLGAVGTCKTVRGNASLERRHVLWTANFTGRCLDAERFDLLLKLSLEERSLLGDALTDEASEGWESAFVQAFNQSYSSCFGVR